MPISIRRYRDGDAGAIERLNARLREGGSGYVVWGEGPNEQRNDPAVYLNRFFVVADGDEIRGGGWLTEHEFSVGGGARRMGWIRYPVSESLVNRDHAGVPGALMLQLLREQPLLMALGLGGHQGVFAQLLARLKWQGELLPFQFLVVAPFRVLRNLAHLRRRAVTRVAADVLAWTGLGALGLLAWRALRDSSRRFTANGISVERVAEFGPWADQLWERTRARFSFAAARSARLLNHNYPAGTPGLTRIRVLRDGDTIGWACLLRNDMRHAEKDRYFGRLAIGLIADCLCDPADADVVLAAATRELRKLDVDLVFTNQAHPSLIQALDRCGYLKGPSRFAFYRAPAVQKLIDGAPPGLHPHVTRGDCDGPRWTGPAGD